jgi:hypothetical protein
MPFWQVSSDLATTPAVVETTAQEVRPLPLDAASLLEPGEAVRSASCTLTDLATNEVVATPRATVDGTTVMTAIRGLQAGHDYKLAWLLTIGPEKKIARITVVRCIG